MVDVKLHNMDCLEFMRGMPDKSVDAVIREAATYRYGDYLFGVIWVDDKEVFVDGDYARCFSCNSTNCYHVMEAHKWKSKS